jgi:hypothetical protein
MEIRTEAQRDALADALRGAALPIVVQVANLRNDVIVFTGADDAGEQTKVIRADGRVAVR